MNDFLNKLSPAQKKLLVVFIILASFVIVTVVFISLVDRSQANIYGDDINITNFDDKIKNLPKERKDAILKALYNIVEKNIDDKDKLSSIKSAVIRNGSNSQTFDGSLYSGSFIVDIKSVSQSYKIEYHYSDDPNNTSLGGYAIIPSCLPISDLIYGDFNCKNLLSDDSNIDPITRILPYSTLDYEIKYHYGDNNKVVVDIKLILSESDYRTDINTIINVRKKEAGDWLASKGFDLSKYTVKYIY